MTKAEDNFLLSLNNVSVAYWLQRGLFRYQQHWALRDITLNVRRGDSVGVVGRNGSGKSTLLRLLAGVIKPDSGVLETRPSLSVSLLSLRLGFVNYLSGRENAILSGLFLGFSKREIHSRLAAIIDFAELGEFIDEPLFSYSTGMRARLGFAVASQLEPDILLVDEVLGVGDTAFKNKATKMMKERIESENTTVVLVSHSSGIVRRLCNRAVWLENGHIVATGDTESIVDEYEESLVQPLELSNAPETPVFLRQSGSKKIYMLQNGSLVPMSCFEEFSEHGGRAKDVQIISADEFDQLMSRYENG